ILLVYENANKRLHNHRAIAQDRGSSGVALVLANLRRYQMLAIEAFGVLLPGQRFALVIEGDRSRTGDAGFEGQNPALVSRLEFVVTRNFWSWADQTPLAFDDVEQVR